MKTIEQLAQEYAYEILGDRESPAMDIYIPHDIIEIFLAGAKAATRWIPVNEDPIPENGEFIILDLNNQVWTKEQFGNAMIIATHWLPIPPMPEK